MYEWPGSRAGPFGHQGMSWLSATSRFATLGERVFPAVVSEHAVLAAGFARRTDLTREFVLFPHAIGPFNQVALNLVLTCGVGGVDEDRDRLTLPVRCRSDKRMRHLRAGAGLFDILEDDAVCTHFARFLAH